MTSDEDSCLVGCISKSDMKTRWWMHRDQKIEKDVARDKAHLKAHPNAFDMERCYQSSVYFTDSVNLEDDAFICCPGSHNWLDEMGWESSGDRHHVSVPESDPRVKEAVRKLIVKKGEMIVWDSRLAHMGGYLTNCSATSKSKNTAFMIQMLRLDPIEWQDASVIKHKLETEGVVLIKDIATASDMDAFREQLRDDIANIYGLEPKKDWKSYPDEIYGRTSKGGGSWGAVCCSRAVWEARLLPRRVAVFKKLLDAENIVVSIDSVHWSVGHPRLSVMASFCAKENRAEYAYKVKCVSQAYGLTRTTHWANNADISGFSYGADRNTKPQERLNAISSEWRGHGCKLPCNLPDISNVSVKGLKAHINKVAQMMTMDEATNLLDFEVSRWF